MAQKKLNKLKLTSLNETFLSFKSLSFLSFKVHSFLASRILLLFCDCSLLINESHVLF